MKKPVGLPNIAANNIQNVASRLVEVVRGLQGERTLRERAVRFADLIDSDIVSVAENGDIVRYAIVADSITDGVTNIAPSQNAVFDALSGKQVAIQFKDEGSSLGSSGTANIVDFVGANVTVTRIGDVVTVTIAGGGGGSGDVVGPASAVNNRVAFFDGATGKLIKDSGLTLSGTNTGDQTITLTGDVTGSGTGTFAASLATVQPTVHTWSLTQTFSVAPVFTDQSGTRTALGLGTAATQNTGTSGATLPFLNGANSFSATQTITDSTTQPLIVNTSAIGDPAFGDLTGIRIAGTDTTTTTRQGVTFYGGDSAGNIRHGACVLMGKESVWTSGSGAYPGYLGFWTRPSGLDEREVMRLNSDGSATFNYAVLATGPLRLVPAAAPGSPANGDLWYDSGLAKFRKREAGVTSDMAGSGSGIVRSVSTIAVNTAAGAASTTDYVYIATASSITLTLPTAVGNTNRYTFKNGAAGNVSAASTGGQTFDGSASPITLIPNQSLDFISDGANWSIA